MDGFDSELFYGLDVGLSFWQRFSRRHTMKKSLLLALVLLNATLGISTEAASRAAGPLTPIRNTTTRGGYTIDTVGDTLGQASPGNTRLIIRIFGPDKKVVKPAQIALIDKGGGMIKPV